MTIMYQQYFGLSALPFSISPDPRYLYLAPQHREALASLLYGIGCDGGFVLLTGEIGTGKTTVCRCLLEQLPPGTEVAFILNPKYGIAELLEAVCDELKIGCPRNGRLKDYIDALNAHLLERHGNGVHCVLIIDEAQNLDDQALEQIRLLTNLETSREKLLQIVLIGQPELLDKLARPQLRQLDQRITARYHLHALSPGEVRDYVAHRLAVSGCEAALFSPAALRALHRLSGGVPRMINILCDRALLGAYVERRRQVDRGVLRRAAAEVLGRHPAAPGRWRRWLWWPAGVALLGALLGLPVAAGDAALWQRLQGWLAGVPSPVLALDAPPDGAAGAQVAVAPLPATADVSLTDASQMAAAAGGGHVEPLPEASLPLQEGGPDAPDGPVTAMSGAATRSASGSPGDWRWPDGADLAASEALAYRALLARWGVDYDPQADPRLCRFARQHGLACLLRPGSLDELLRLDLPAVVSLRNALGETVHAALVALDRAAGQVRLEVAGESRWVALDALRPWLDEPRLLLWRLPPGYRQPLRPEGQGPLVDWLAAQLARLQGERPPPAAPGRRYDEPLQLQVLAFQHYNRLNTDAVVGPQTIIRLSALTATDLPLLSRAGAVEPDDAGR